MRLKTVCLLVLAWFIGGNLFSQTITTVPVVTHVSCLGNTTGSVVLNSTTGGTSPYTYTWMPGSTNSNSITGKGIGNYSVTIKDASTNSITANYNIGYKVCWQNMYVGTVVSGDDLVNSRADLGNNWLQTGNSSNILSGSTDGWVEYIATTTTHHKVFGLLDSASGTAFNNIDYAIYMRNDAVLRTMNNGTETTIGTYTVGTVLRIERVGNTINFKKNNVTIWTTTISSGMQQARLTVRGAVYTYSSRLERVGCSFESVNAGATLSNTITCSVGTATLTANTNIAGASYSWTPNGTAPTGSATTVSAGGTYTLSVTNPTSSCVSTITLTVPTNTVLPNVSAGPNKVRGCSAITVLLTGSSTTPGATYSWTPGGSTPTNSTTSVSSAGTYSLKVTDPANGCSATSTVAVTINTTVPNVNAGSTKTITCSSPTVTLNGSSSTSGVTFSWTAGGSTPTNSTTAVTVVGTYTLKVTNPVNDCSATATVAVVSNTTAPNVNAGSTKTITCSAPTVTLNGSSSTPGVTFSWTPGGGTPTNSNTAVTSVGTYTLKVTNPVNGCFATATVAVVSNTTLPNVSAGSNKTITCSAPTVTLNGSSSTPGVTYSWTPGGSTPTNSTTAVSSAGTYTLKVTNPASGCSATATVAVFLATPPFVNPPYVMYTLLGLPFNLGATPAVSGGTAPYTYTWTEVGGPLSSNVQNPSVSGITVNTTYSLASTDAQGCVTSHTILVSVLSGPNCYGKPDKQIDGGVYQVQGGKLYFSFYEEYRDRANVQFTIFDDNRYVRLASSGSSPAVVLGDNRYMINLSSSGFSSGDNGKTFVMEVLNEKQELVLLKFKYAQ